MYLIDLNYFRSHKDYMHVKISELNILIYSFFAGLLKCGFSGSQLSAL